MQVHAELFDKLQDVGLQGIGEKRAKAIREADDGIATDDLEAQIAAIEVWFAERKISSVGVQKTALMPFLAFVKCMWRETWMLTATFVFPSFPFCGVSLGARSER